MDWVGVVGGGEYVLGSRIPLMRRDAAEAIVREQSLAAASPLVVREEECSGPNAHLCERPAATATNYTLSIALGISIPLGLLAIAIFWLNRRKRQRQRREDAADPHKSLDFGMMMDGGGKLGRGKRHGGGGAEKPGHVRGHGISMDLNMSSPYLLPPGLQSSRESLHSLARTLHQNEDPYRPIQGFTGSDAGSVRSFKRNGPEDSSIYTGSSGSKETGYQSRQPPTPAVSIPPLRKGSLLRSPTLSIEPAPPRYEASHTEAIQPPSPAPVKDSFTAQAQPGHRQPFDATPLPDDKTGVVSLTTLTMLDIPEPPPAASKFGIAGVPTSPRPLIGISSTPESRREEAPVSQNKQQFNFFDDEPDVTPASAVPQPQPTVAPPQSLSNDRTGDQAVHTSIVENNETNTDRQIAVPALRLEDEYEERGRSQHRRQSSEYPPDFPSAGLDVPRHDQKRMSIGFRPLPPDEVMETEDPETRANRIRSFYKEYFDDSKPQDLAHSHRPGHNVRAGHLHPAGNGQGGGYGEYQGGYGNGQPQASYGGYNNQGDAHYYEDYDQNYLGDATYFDPHSNSFVMPYAEHVARRAMTPPPSGSRFPGPRSGPRVHHGSFGGVSAPGGRQGPYRPGSSASNNRWGPGPRPGSSASQQPYGRPRAGSAYSARSGPRKLIPPPAALTTLPNPSKLRDDSFAIFSAADFAPPTTFKDQAAGRSQSPIGERKTYQAPLGVHSPLVSAFEEMAPLPSPHILRKSGTFTGLDFAPPRKFKDADTMSDAGSIRSNRSGISAVHLGAIRNGAGRVSRLPGDTIFTQAEMSNQLKPQWTMRP